MGYTSKSWSVLCHCLHIAAFIIVSCWKVLQRHPNVIICNILILFCVICFVNYFTLSWQNEWNDQIIFIEINSYTEMYSIFVNNVSHWGLVFLISLSAQVIVCARKVLVFVGRRGNRTDYRMINEGFGLQISISLGGISNNVDINHLVNHYRFSLRRFLCLPFIIILNVSIASIYWKKILKFLCMVKSYYKGSMDRAMMLLQISVTFLLFGDQGGGARNGPLERGDWYASTISKLSFTNKNLEIFFLWCMTHQTSTYEMKHENAQRLNRVGSSIYLTGINFGNC